MLTSIMLATGCLLASREISSAVFPLTNASAIHQLPLDEARGSRPVDLTATVTYSDRSGTLFVADQSGGVYVIQPKRARYPRRHRDFASHENGQSGGYRSLYSCLEGRRVSLNTYARRNGIPCWNCTSLCGFAGRRLS